MQKVVLLIQLVTILIETIILSEPAMFFLIILGNTLFGLNQIFLFNGTRKILQPERKGIPLKEILFSKLFLLFAILVFFKINAYLLFAASLIYVLQLLLITLIIKKKKIYEE